MSEYINCVTYIFTFQLLTAISCDYNVSAVEYADSDDSSSDIEFFVDEEDSSEEEEEKEDSEIDESLRSFEGYLMSMDGSDKDPEPAKAIKQSVAKLLKATGNYLINYTVIDTYYEMSVLIIVQCCHMD